MRSALLFLVLWLLGLTWAAADPARVMFIGAHPDDDSGATGYLGSLVASGRASVTVVTLSRGEGGGNALGQGSGASLGHVREAEERAALASLGITRVIYLDRVDWGYTTSYAATASRWDHDLCLSRLVELLLREKPDIIVTMNPFPSGHGHHQFAARLATEAYFAAGISSELVYALSYGQDGFEPDFVYTPVGEQELNALRHYVSQGWDALPTTGPTFVLGAETFFVAHGNSALFPARSHGPRAQSEVSVQLAPIPAVAAYRDWALKLGLDPVLSEPEARMVAGRPSTVELEVTNRGEKAAKVEIAPPAGVRWTRGPFQQSAPPGVTRVVLEGVAERPGAVATEYGRLEVVPFYQAPEPGTVDQLWEGSPSQVRAEFSLSSRESDLSFVAHVRDDRICRQIAPEDASAHWRTDAVELDIDPSGASENTLTTFKLGIIPFASNGQPLAFRDADARPGPVPGLTVTSELEEGGYVVRVTIPRAEVGELAPEFGLNVLVYDADDTNTPIGSNAGLSRIGWSAWPEVMGNPRLWGRARLEGSPEGESKRAPHVQFPLQTAASRASGNGRPPAGVP